jgi:murein hydrolase activator
MRGPVAALVLLGGAAALAAEDLETERQQVQDRLLAERAALAALKDQHAELLAVVEWVEERARVAQARATLAERELTAVQRRVELMGRLEAETSAQAERLTGQLGPRLRAAYRLQRRTALEVLLSADGFAEVVRRGKALGRLLTTDIELLRDAQRAKRLQRRTARAAAALAQSAQGKVARAAAERARAKAHQATLADLLELVQADASRAARVVRELEVADRKLERLIAEMESDLTHSAFGAQKGSLPYPTAGMVEVPFGKVVNPKFNTVTFQKGLDLRARKGAAVIAVADGRVVYAGWLRGYGNLLIVDHGNGYHTLMGHLDRFTRSVGEAVAGGEVVGRVGDSGSLKGPYLYFELRKNGTAIDPADWLVAPEE